ncbi:hypothetical protein GDO81_014368 [Engystomops pustulosus]|uniref:Uncharacterized protein n=1 Tax=Engystomops pustulosus TaxID=76066 RepID=A0AAV7BA13_ENGPU|nr:hypothetical protein GDO81_014368 [Engystomops pustulosus]
MATIKSSRTWADIQESLSRVRQQYGLLPRAEWDDLIAMTSYEKAMSAKHKNKSLPRQYLPSLTSKSNWDLRRAEMEYADAKRHKQQEGRRSAKYDYFYPKPVLVKNTERMKPTTEHTAYRYFTENKHFAGDFVDSFILENLTNEIVPDVLIEALTNNTQMPKKKHYGKKARHWKSEYVYFCTYTLLYVAKKMMSLGISLLGYSSRKMANRTPNGNQMTGLTTKDSFGFLLDCPLFCHQIFPPFKTFRNPSEDGNVA